ncbi:MAG: hypothetical protein ABIH03_07075 [Pseudomonadota bacterium]
MLQTVLDGQPTRPYVEGVIARARQTRPGELIDYAELERLADAKHGSHRFRTVMNVAIRRMRQETGVELVCERNLGYIVSTGLQQFQYALGKHRSHVRGERKSAAIAGLISDERLTDPNARAACRHFVEAALYRTELARLDNKTARLSLGRTELPPPK